MEELNNTNNWSLYPIYTSINTFPVKKVQKREETGGLFVRQAVVYTKYINQTDANYSPCLL